MNALPKLIDDGPLLAPGTVLFPTQSWLLNAHTVLTLIKCTHDPAELDEQTVAFLRESVTQHYRLWGVRTVRVVFGWGQVPLVHLVEYPSEAGALPSLNAQPIDTSEVEQLVPLDWEFFA
ncbi:hypothetical protein AB0J38_14615 [Streptomyces sp. NPDC050095]|uniref:hypothetical protein n=1 Tax=unclassified Streptomyces TaxID=2593676 RepID=UPI003429011C